MHEPFFFGIPLIARRAARDWDRIGTLLDLTLGSLEAQSAGGFSVLLAGHDLPEPARGRVQFIKADWPADAPDAANNDAGRKKKAIEEAVMARGGGLLMFVDADDWVDTGLVAAARAALADGRCGAVVGGGVAVDIRSLRVAPLPHPAIFDRGFHALCGSSTLARLSPAAPDPLRRNPFAVLHEHYRFPEMARRHGLPVAELPVAGAYLVNTAENHSETAGPFAAWRRALNAGVNAHGAPLSQRLAARFGLDLDHVRSASSRLRS